MSAPAIEKPPAEERVFFLKRKNKVLHREVHRLCVELRYLRIALRARDEQLALMTRHAQELAVRIPSEAVSESIARLARGKERRRDARVLGEES